MSSRRPTIGLPTNRAFHILAPYGVAAGALVLCAVIVFSTSDLMAWTLMALTGLAVIFWLVLIRRAFRDVGALAWFTIPSGLMAVLAASPIPIFWAACVFGFGCI